MLEREWREKTWLEPGKLRYKHPAACTCKDCANKRLDKLGLLKETPLERALRLSREREKYRGAKGS